MDFTGRRAELKADFVAKRGYWGDFWDSLLALDPDYFEAYLNYSSLPWLKGVLEPKVKEFVYIAIDVATTHLYEPGLRIHFQNALRYGATRHELLDVIKVVSTLGIHTATLGMPLLRQALEKTGVATPETDERRRALRTRFERELGYWQPHWDDFLALAPDYFEAHLEMATSPLRSNALDPKVIEFMHIAACASTTHLYAPALEVHLARALALGATREEIVEIYELASVLGMHSCTMGLPILVEELAAVGQTIGPEG